LKIFRERIEYSLTLYLSEKEYVMTGGVMQVFAILFAIVTTAVGQSNFATITGTITGRTNTDPNGAIAGKVIEAKNDATGAVFEATTSANGGYALHGLPPGTYRLWVIGRPGFIDYRRTIILAPSQTLRVDVPLLSPGTGGGVRRAPRTLPTGPPSRGPDGRPDLSGLWYPTPRTFDWGKPDLLPEMEAVVEERLASGLRDHPSARCLPSGVGPMIMFNPRYRIVQTPQYLALLLEEPVRNFREIFLDGREHPKDPNPTWLGHSIGHWDGDTLLVDSIGFNGKIWLDLPATSALLATEKLHVIERYRRIDLGHLEVEITIDDPGAYRKPWTVKGVSELAVNDNIDENICNENNKTPEHLQGK
jgi:hypothetical protein